MLGQKNKLRDGATVIAGVAVLGGVVGVNRGGWLRSRIGLGLREDEESEEIHTELSVSLELRQAEAMMVSRLICCSL